MSDRAPSRLEGLDRDELGRGYSPSAGRNQRDVVAALVAELPACGVCLELASGTGEHAVLAAERLPGWRWFPTDRDDEALASIQAWVDHAGLGNLAAPKRLDLTEPWTRAPASLDAVFASNLTHIAPLSTSAALFAGCATSLTPSGPLLVYGPIFLSGEAAAQGNLDFDRELRERDAELGVRRQEELESLAGDAGLRLASVRRMPRNNAMLRFEWA